MQGNFTNTTPIKATFTKEGKYTIVLTLIDIANNNSIITANSFNIDVSSEETTPTVNNTISNTINNNVVEELPKTGTSIGEYITYFFILGSIFLGCTIYFNKKRYNN